MLYAPMLASLLRFLERCNQRNVKLNTEKLQVRKTEAPFIGHVASGVGLKIHPAKVSALVEMPERAATGRYGYVPDEVRTEIDRTQGICWHTKTHSGNMDTYKRKHSRRSRTQSPIHLH